MRIRAVHIDQPGPDAAQQIQGDGRAVDELFVATLGDDAADDEPTFFAQRHTGFIQQTVDLLRVSQMKHCFDAAL